MGCPQESSARLNKPSSSSYGQIFRSTALIGGASVVSILLGIIRTKFMALWLGPAGVGLMGLYNSIVDLAATTAGMGIGSSGVRQIAEATGSGDEQRIARTIKSLRRTCLVFGGLGAVALAALSYPISRLTFGDSQHAVAIAVLGLTVFFGAVSGGQLALVQGMRRIADLAGLKVLGALWGTVFGLTVIWFWRESGIVPLLVILSLMSLLTSWWFARRIPVAPVNLGMRETALEARGLLSLGLVFMASALMSSGVSYLTRLIVVRELGVEAVGHYSAAYTLAGLYVGFILQAMGTDFYPRLTAVAADNDAVNRMVNEQAEISILLAVPGVLATLTLSTWVIAIFYSGNFEPAGEVLRWQVLGILGRVISWPMGFILIAKGSRRMFLTAEVIASIVHVGLLWWGVRIWVLPGTGMAFFGLYAFHVLFMMLVSRRESGFRWSSVNTRIMSWMLPAVAVVFVATDMLPQVLATLAGGAVTAVCSWFCLRGLLKRIPAHRLGWFARWAM